MITSLDTDVIIMPDLIVFFKNYFKHNFQIIQLEKKYHYATLKHKILREDFKIKKSLEFSDQHVNKPLSKNNFKQHQHKPLHTTLQCWDAVTFKIPPKTALL